MVWPDKARDSGSGYPSPAGYVGNLSEAGARSRLIGVVKSQACARQTLSLTGTPGNAVIQIPDGEGLRNRPWYLPSGSQSVALPENPVKDKPYG